MVKKNKKFENRYVNDLRRIGYAQTQVVNSRSSFVLIGIAITFLLAVGSIVFGYFVENDGQALILVAAAVIGGYMAMNIGANDVANNMGPAVGGKVLTITAAVVIAVVCEAAGALLAGGDVVKTVAKGIVSPGSGINVNDFQLMMLSALLSAAVWINLATLMNAPVSTTHSIVGGVLGGGVAAAGPDIAVPTQSALATIPRAPAATTLAPSTPPTTGNAQTAACDLLAPPETPPKRDRTCKKR